MKFKIIVCEEDFNRFTKFGISNQDSSKYGRAWIGLNGVIVIAPQHEERFFLASTGHNPAKCEDEALLEGDDYLVLLWDEVSKEEWEEEVPFFGAISVIETDVVPPNLVF